MAKFYISDIEQQIKNIDRYYFDLTKEKRMNSHLHIIPHGPWEDGYLWWNKNCWCVQNILNPFKVYYSTNDIIFFDYNNLQTWFNFCIRVNAEEYPKEVITYYTKRIFPNSPMDIYVYEPIGEIINKTYSALNREGLYLSMGFILQSPVVMPFFNFSSDTNLLNANQFNSLERHIESMYAKIDTIQQDKIQRFHQARNNYLQSSNGIPDYLYFLLEESFYSFIFNKIIEVDYQDDTSTLIIDYVLPNKQEMPNEVVNKDLGWNQIAATKEKNSMTHCFMQSHCVP